MLNVITLRLGTFDYTNRIISDDLYLVVFSNPLKSNHNTRLITLTVITLSCFYCN